MIETKCANCGKTVKNYPSRVRKENFCSNACRITITSKRMMIAGQTTRFAKGMHRPAKWIKITKIKTSGQNHWHWKGKQVSYRGLHMWLYRQLGKPTKCSKCKKFSTKPRVIQWANIDGRYRRILSDYIPLCNICHPKYDKILRATLGGPMSKK